MGPLILKNIQRPPVIDSRLRWARCPNTAGTTIL